jgi:hypothetical protein
MGASAGTIFWTVTAGVSVYVLGQIFTRWFIDPVHDLHRLIAEIGETLIRERATLTTGKGVQLAPEVYDRLRNDLRRMSSLLPIRMFMVPGYEWFAATKIVRPRKELLSASGDLRWLANTVGVAGGITEIDRVETRVRAIGVALGIRGLWEES